MIKEFCGKSDDSYTIGYDTQINKMYIYDDVEHRRLDDEEVFVFVVNLFLNNIVLEKKFKDCKNDYNDLKKIYF